jgi:hypothetical protein
MRIAYIRGGGLWAFDPAQLEREVKGIGARTCPMLGGGEAPGERAARGWPPRPVVADSPLRKGARQPYGAEKGKRKAAEDRRRNGDSRPFFFCRKKESAWQSGRDANFFPLFLRRRWSVFFLFFLFAKKGLNIKHGPSLYKSFVIEGCMRI